MKKKFVFTMILLLLFMLAGCMKEENYYDRQEIDALFEEQQKKDIEERYFQNVIVPTIIDEEEIYFTQLGVYVFGAVDAWGYEYVVYEMETSKKVVIEIDRTAPNGDWNLNLYYGTLNDSNLTFTEIQEGDKYVVTFQSGFNTIEFDSYADYSDGFGIRVSEVIDDSDET